MRYIPLLLVTLFVTPAFAQDYSGMQSRLERLERDLTFLQRQVYQGGAAGDPNGAPGATGGAATTQIMQIQEELRALRGQIEQAEYKSQQVQSDFLKYREDVDFRLQQLERQAAAPVASAVPEPEAIEPVAEAPRPVPKSTGFNINEGTGNAEQAAAQYEPEAAVEPAKSGYDTPRDHYNNAFKLLNDAKYAEAAAGFDSFTKKYPKDALTPNAYYWMGESYYARRDFKSAAEGFRMGYESNPKSQKAPDNLLKLSLSLANLKRMDEACIVLKQVSAQYATTHKTTAAKADSEYKRLGCA